MMILLSSHNFLLIPSVLAIIMASLVHPYPYTETKSWIHQRDQTLQQNEASRSSFGGDCPDCMSQEEASLRLLLLPPTYKTSKMTKMMLALLPQSSSPPAPALEQDVKVDYEFNEKGEEEGDTFTGASDNPEVADDYDFPLLHHSNQLTSLSSSNNNNLSSYYKNVGRRRRIKRNERRRSRSSAVESFSLSKDLRRSSSSQAINIRRRRHSRDTSTLTPCIAEREERLGQAQFSRSSEYVPNCRKDGSYAHVQCHPSTKSCWCVTRNGRAIPGTSVLSSDSNTMARPNCAKYTRRTKSTTRRSSQFRKNRKCKHSSCVDPLNDNDDDDDMDSSDISEDLDDDHSDDVEFSRDLSCNHADWTKFSIALLKAFRSEYNRYRSLTAATSSGESASDRVVLSWKFDHVDRNKDRILQRNETNILKNLVKQQIQPRACAKNFIPSCSNGDSQITKKEWLDCFRVSSDFNLSYDMFKSLVDTSTTRGLRPMLQVSSSSTSTSGSGSMEATLPFLSSGTVGETTEQSNCWNDRQSALASQKQNESIIIPECTSNGNYRRVQCAQGKEYCWCVEEETGIQIPNTIVFNTTLDCNNGYSKPMKGCSGVKKHKFLIDLFSTLKARMDEATRDGRTRGQGDGPRNISVEEQASRWYFTELDVNSNGILDRKEWKTFRNETSLDKRLKKCGKKLPRHCDVNQDKKITMTEWLDCLGVKYLGKFQTHSDRKRPVKGRSFRGRNPILDLLKQRRRR